ncbi:MAG: cytochrome c biogenesis protein CcdA [Candidatus Buchananbacteria bacterium CG10_big_fil_rev_8_21_14_0_10_42_9]|uniref:Cytochrome c biogenesis protein CcdA n=1 Tax=Candidatus Buchananbacteria bacterium CG10_big_fil_rev_8_21_14_0_10_42_9 TaxID=1974526 RepID=A0A2H0VZZ1_9BACT|nr:MAG: cytochrome c biogenesis protein CcdA [Candidatus Buchananbacteria bacterium CG10_big_fil_rev_8_21_14_0_10_42_9]
MDVILGASIIAAFFAGMVALFAPCCITVLLPTYLASAFRERKQMLKMTFVFFGGIAVVLVPIGLGAAGLAEVFKSAHRELYVFGGGLMIIFGIMSFLGKGKSIIPMPKLWQAKLNVTHTKSVFLLGIFSGAATSCCAPVLAGAVTLAVISGTFWKALIVTFAYVFGMTFPLFLAAYFYDKFKLEKNKLIQGKVWSVKLAKKTYYVHSSNILAGSVFLLMGIMLWWLALSGNAFWSPAWQAKLGNALQQRSENIVETLMSVPDVVWGVMVVGFFSYLAFVAWKNNK